MNTRKPSVIVGHFSWEEWDDQIIAVIHRSDRRFVVKRYAERVLANSRQWQQLAQSSFSLVEPVARAHTIADNEVKLMHSIFDWHLNGTLKLMIVAGLDQLLDWEDVLDFAKRAEQARNSGRQTAASTTRSPSIVPTIPVGISSLKLSSTAPISKCMTRQKSTEKSDLPPVKTNKKSLAVLRQQPSCNENTISCPSSSSGNWVQINNVCVPYIIKSQQSRLIPYQVLLECNLLNPDDQPLLQHYTIAASSHDVETFQTIISSSSSIESTLSADLLLIDLHHLMFGISTVVYIKLLDNQRDVNKSYKTVLAQRGGTVLIRSHSISFITRGKLDYILFDSLLAIFRPTTKFMPMLRSRTLPGQSHEIDYLRLVQFYQNNHRHHHNDTIINQHRPLLVSITDVREHLNENDFLVDLLLTQYQRLEHQTMKNEIMKTKIKPARKAIKRKASAAMLEVQNTAMER